MRVLLTGGAGFIGSHVSDMLINNRHEVIVIDNLSSGKEENMNPKAVLYKEDIRDSVVKEIMERERPEAVIHHAAQVNVRDSVEDPLYDMDVNIGGTSYRFSMRIILPGNTLPWRKTFKRAAFLEDISSLGLEQMLAGLITYILLAIYCHDEYQEHVFVKRLREFIYNNLTGHRWVII